MRSLHRSVLGFVVAALSTSAVSACSSSQGGTPSGSPSGSSGSGATSGSSASTGTASAGNGSSSSGSSAGTATSGTSSGQSTSGVGSTSGSAAGSSSGSIGASGSTSGNSAGAASGEDLDGGPTDATTQNGPDEGILVVDGAGRTPPTCATPTPPPNEPPAPSRASECDYLLQSLDFDDEYSYVASAIKVTDFGEAFGLYAINNCSPYCYKKNLTVGIDIVGGGSAAQLQGEIIVEFPTTGPGLPITMSAMRNSLAWITFDGAAKPPFEIDTQLVYETTTGVVPADDKQTKKFFATGGGQNPFGPFNVTNNYSYNNGCEFKFFNVATGFATPPVNVIGMGFRIVAKATAGQEWHGVAYIDHMQIRADGMSDDPNTAYPYGL